MSDHIIVCGMGDVGFRIVELLHRLGESVVVVTAEARDDRRQAAEEFGVRVMTGDARNERLLMDAGLASARGIIAATDQDLVNIEVALDARRLHPDIPIVIRLFDQDLARQLEGALDLRRALGMAALAAPSFAAAAMGDSILGGFALSGVPYVLGRQVVRDGTLVRGTTVRTAAARQGLRALVLERPGQACSPLPGDDEVLKPGDRLALFGRKEDWDRLVPGTEAPLAAGPATPRRRLRYALRRLFGVWREEPLMVRAVFVSVCLLIPLAVFLFRHYLSLTLTDAVFFTVTTLHGEISLTEGGPQIKISEILLMVLGSITIATIYSMITDYLLSSRLRKLLGGKPMPKKNHIVVVGMGTVGYRVVQELAALDVPVVAVESDPDAPFLSTVRSQAPVIVGDARLGETLERAGLPRARAVVAATGDDAVNLGIGLTAHRQNPAVRTVVRLFDADFARKVESTLRIDAAFGASRIAAPTFAASVLFPDVKKAFIVQDRLLVLRHCRVGADWAGKTPAGLAGAESPVRILLRNGREQTPGESADPLGAGEEVLAVLWRQLAPPWSEQTDRPGTA
jgi:Trk K+ transport system NAD-binding subunit